MTLARPMFPPVDSSRRGFLAQAAVVAAGGAALGMALPLPVSAGDSQRVPDPILAAIEAHRAAAAVALAVIGRLAVFERQLQAADRLQTKSRLLDELRQGEEIEAALDQAHHAEQVAAYALLDDNPTTLAGVIALLTYATEYDDATDGMGWPCDVEPAEERGNRTWQYFVIANLVDILPKLMPASA